MATTNKETEEKYTVRQYCYLKGFKKENSIISLERNNKEKLTAKEWQSKLKNKGFNF